MDRLWRSNSSISSRSSCPLNIVNEEEEGTRSKSPTDPDFQSPIIETPVFHSKLRVLNVLNKIFEIDMVSLYNEFISAKNRDKRKYYQSTFA